ncbi:hypothetical protein [Streptomyces spiramenti]|uniref:Uncharacterized protein n=1 Tax=Streptomyces spiramenti TaxID=2720606 RepID=A0ABX1AME1_9ACTN|nr:hypothetical protein [Streptomyces spiramenti]
MEAAEADARLAWLDAEMAAVETSLLALRDHPGRRLLTGAELTGDTRTRWEDADRLLARLWGWHCTGRATLERAQAVRALRRTPGRGELVELTELLTGACLTVEEPGAAPERLGWEQLVARTNVGYADVLEVVLAVDAVWSALPARVELLTAELRRIAELARSVGVVRGEHPAADVLAGVSAELTELRARATGDPLALWRPVGGSSEPGGGRVDTSGFDRAERAVEDARREVEDVITVHRDADERLAQVRDVLSRADRTLAEARTARGEVLAKIAAWEVPHVRGSVAALQERLATAVTHRRARRWARLAPLLADLEHRADEELFLAREALTAVTAPLAVRAELRGRLDAYRAKAARLGSGAVESAPLYDAARRTLWSAPCNLRTAEQLVRTYQEATLRPSAAAERDTEVAGGEAG